LKFEADILVSTSMASIWKKYQLVISNGPRVKWTTCQPVGPILYAYECQKFEEKHPLAREFVYLQPAKVSRDDLLGDA
jgi:hypothetical protein